MAKLNCLVLNPLLLIIWALVAIDVVAAVASNQSATFQESQKWGPYRPNLYLGVRPQVPNTLLMGLMWGDGSGSQAEMLECKPSASRLRRPNLIFHAHACIHAFSSPGFV